MHKDFAAEMSAISAQSRVSDSEYLCVSQEIVNRHSNLGFAVVGELSKKCLEGTCFRTLPTDGLAMLFTAQSIL
jgi:hypothetical protein